RGPARAAVANRMEGMGRDGEAALRVDEVDRFRDGQPRRDPLLQVKGEEVPVERADLLADHDVHPQTRVVARELARLDRSGDPVVIGEGEDVDAPRCRPHNILRRLYAVAPPGVHVKIRAPQGRPGLRSESGRRASVAHRGSSIAYPQPSAGM